ncbi:MAG: hypothetical protein AAB731_00030, partial [Patescibacteria group bacterium]
MKIAIGILGALAIVGYIVGIALAHSSKMPEKAPRWPVAGISIIIAWASAFVMAMISDWGNDW